MANTTPLMAQYRDIKSRYQDFVLLFRVGDFYETFYDDAVDVAKILNIALTTRDKNRPNPVPLAGVPFHAAENYITRLLAAGRSVAICEQVEDAAEAKGLVRRDVVEVLTPGTAMNAQLLDSRESQYCLGVHGVGAMVGLALVDVTTGELRVAEGHVHEVLHLLQGKRVKELFVSENCSDAEAASFATVTGGPFVTRLEAAFFEEAQVRMAIERQHGEAIPDTLEESGLGRVAVGAVLGYLQRLRGDRLPQVVSVKPLAEARFLNMDEETIRNLELFEPLYGGDQKATLLKLIDRTLTPMGAREIRSWLERPLRDVEAIDGRLDAVAEVYGDTQTHEELAAVLRGVNDITRLSARIAARKAIPRELHALRESLEGLPKLKSALGKSESVLLRELGAVIDHHASLSSTIGRAIVPEPPGHLREGGVIAKGYSEELDRLIEASDEAKQWIASLERQERERTGISTLKVGFNKVFGYYIEVSKANSQHVPPDYMAKQTLVNAERYYTATLKEKEQLILESEERRVATEQKLFDSLCSVVSDCVPTLQITALSIAQVDAIQSLAAVARRQRFKRPVVDDSRRMELVGNRHPVLEHLVDEPFVPNDLNLDPERRQFALITGPNMSGKSTFLRQVALAVVLAQMGSFVPAERARVGLVDQIFTRVGAGDRLSRGESTFLVEMKETSYILDRMSDRSLVLLDEVGRGTSTYDGLSIAWAVTEYILEGVKARPKTLFATHFHELTQLRTVYPRLLNLKITIREWEGGVVFLRKIVSGTSDRSYGIHAARVAGLPPHVLKRAEEILHILELRRDMLHHGVALDNGAGSQFSLFSPPVAATPAEANTSAEIDALRRRLASFDVDASTPLEALQFIQALKAEMGRNDTGTS